MGNRAKALQEARRKERYIEDQIEMADQWLSGKIGDIKDPGFYFDREIGNGYLAHLKEESTICGHLDIGRMLSLHCSRRADLRKSQLVFNGVLPVQQGQGLSYGGRDIVICA